MYSTKSNCKNNELAISMPEPTTYRTIVTSSWSTNYASRFHNKFGNKFLMIFPIFLQKISWICKIVIIAVLHLKKTKKMLFSLKRFPLKYLLKTLVLSNWFDKVKRHFVQIEIESKIKYRILRNGKHKYLGRLHKSYFKFRKSKQCFKYQIY